MKMTEPVTPNKLSAKLSETLTWGDDEEFENFPFDEIEVGEAVRSPSKRKGAEARVGTVGLGTPPKMFKANQHHHLSARAGKLQPGGSKRLAFDSPATYQKKLSLSSPFTYPDRKPKQQALSAELNMDDSFDDFDCSLIEKDAF